MKRLTLSLALMAVCFGSIAWVEQTYFSDSATTNATASTMAGAQGLAAGYLRRAIVSIPARTSNVTVTLVEQNGTAMLSTNLANAGSLTVTWTTNLLHGRYKITTAGAQSTNFISGTVTSAVSGTVTVDILEDK